MSKLVMKCFLCSKRSKEVSKLVGDSWFGKYICDGCIWQCLPSIVTPRQALEILPLLEEDQTEARAGFATRVVESGDELIIHDLFQAVFAITPSTRDGGIRLEEKLKPRLSSEQVNQGLQVLLQKSTWQYLGQTLDWLARMPAHQAIAERIANRVVAEGELDGAFIALLCLPSDRFKEIRLTAIRIILGHERCFSIADRWHPGTVLTEEEAEMFIRKSWDDPNLAIALLRGRRRCFHAYVYEKARREQWLFSDAKASRFVRGVASAGPEFQASMLKNGKHLLDRDLTPDEGEVLVERLLRDTLDAIKKGEGDPMHQAHLVQENIERIRMYHSPARIQVYERESKELMRKLETK